MINFILENETKIGVAVLCAALVHIMGVVLTCQDHAHDVTEGGTQHCHAYFCYILQKEVIYVSGTNKIPFFFFAGLLSSRD